MARHRRPALLPRDAAARGGRRPRDPLGHGEVAPASIPVGPSQRHGPCRGHGPGPGSGRAVRMTTPIDPVERHLPEALTDLAAPRTPDYFIDILGQTARVRQRPAWLRPGRWIGMNGFLGRPQLVAVIVVLVAIVGGGMLLHAAQPGDCRHSPDIAPSISGFVGVIRQYVSCLGRRPVLVGLAWRPPTRGRSSRRNGTSFRCDFCQRDPCEPRGRGRPDIVSIR